MKHFTLIAGAVFLSLSEILAGGFQVALQGQKQIGMGHIGVPLLLDASSIYFNPGALPMLNKTFSANVGASFITSNVAFQNQKNAYNASTENPMGTPLELYANYILKEKISVGLGVYTPFGSAVKWQDDWAGRYLIQSIQLRSIFIQPTVGYKVLDNLGIGVGFVYCTGNVGLKRALPVPVGNNTEVVELNGKATGIGANFGIHFSPIENLNLGLTFKTKIDMKAEGADATFTVPASLASNFPAANKFSTKLPLPGSVNFGASYALNEKLTLAMELNFVDWAAYDSLIFDFETNTAGLADSRNPRHYESTVAFRLGADYKVTDQISARAGAYYDPSPIPDNFFAPETPNANNIGLSCGGSYSPIEKLSVDVSFLYILGLERESYYSPANFGGNYKSAAVIPGIGLTYQF